MGDRINFKGGKSFLRTKKAEQVWERINKSTVLASTHPPVQVIVPLIAILIGRCYRLTIRGGFETLNNEIIWLCYHKSCRLFYQADPIRVGDKFNAKVYLKNRYFGGLKK